MAEAGEEMVGVFLVKRHRRANLQHIVERAIRADQHALVSQAVGDERRFDTRRLEGFWIAHQLEAPEESRTANIADQRKLQCECAKAGSQDVAR